MRGSFQSKTEDDIFMCLTVAARVSISQCVIHFLLSRFTKNRIVLAVMNNSSFIKVGIINHTLFSVNFCLP